MKIREKKKMIKRIIMEVEILAVHMKLRSGGMIKKARK